MKKTLSTLLLVLFAVGLLVSCNADAIEELFQKDNPSVSTTYTVTFDIQGHGEQITSYSNVVSGATVSAPPAPAADGFIFYGWYKEAACTNEWKFDTDTVTEDTTLYARWVKSTIEGILSTVESFPISSSLMAAPDNAWTAENGNKCYRYNNDLCFITTPFSLKSVGLSENVVKSENDYIYNCLNHTVTFHMTGDVLTSITYTEESTLDGTYDTLDANLSMKKGDTEYDWNKITITIKGNDIVSASYSFGKTSDGSPESIQLTPNEIQSVNSDEGLSIVKEDLEGETEYKTVLVVTNSAGYLKTIAKVQDTGEVPPPL